MARYLLRNDADAEDAAQEVFSSLWSHRDSIEAGKERAWLMRVTRNECFDRIRRRRPESEWNDETVVEERGPMDATEQGELSRQLATAIAELDEPARSLVVLRDMQQYSYEEISQMQSLSLSQVKVYLHRARARLREQLEVKAL